MTARKSKPTTAAPKKPAAAKSARKPATTTLDQALDAIKRRSDELTLNIDTLLARLG